MMFGFFDGKKREPVSQEDRGDNKLVVRVEKMILLLVCSEEQLDALKKAQDQLQREFPR